MISIQDNVVYLTVTKGLTDWLNSEYPEKTFVATNGPSFRPVCFPPGETNEVLNCDIIDVPISLCSPAIAFDDASKKDIELLVRNLVEWLIKESNADILYLSSLEGRVVFMGDTGYVSEKVPGIGCVGIEWKLRGLVDG